MSDDSTQSEILQLRKEIERLQTQLRAQQAPTSVRPDATSLINDHDFITDLARFAEAICTEAEVRKRWRLTDEDWERAGSDDALVRAIQDEKVRRVRNGATARERAQKIFTETPEVLGN